MLQENSAIRAATAGIIPPVCSEPLCESSSGTTGFGKSLTPDMTIPLILRIASLPAPPHKYFSNSEVWELGGRYEEE